MNDTELRARFDEWAAPLRAAPPPQVAVIRARARRRTAGVAGAAGFALVVAGVITGLVVSALVAPTAAARPAVWGTARYPAPPGQPYVFVNQSASGPAEIRNVATGTVVRRLRPLDHRGIFTSVAVTRNDRLFVLAQQDAAGVTFAAARISPPGSVHFSRIMPQVSIPAAQVYWMTVNPAGTRLVLNTFAAGPPGGPGKLLLYDLTTGALLGSWQDASPPAVDYWPSDDALALELPLTPAAPSGPLRILPTTSAFRRGSAFGADTRPDLSLPGYTIGLITADGSRALAVPQLGGTEVLQEFSTATGRLLLSIPIGSEWDQLLTPYFCGVLWASANGRDVLTQCGSKQLAVSNGAVTKIRLPWRFLAKQNAAIDTYAW